jgi:acetyl esterase/lipase
MEPHTDLGGAMDLNLVAPELRSVARRLPDVPVDRALVRGLVRTVGRLLRAPRVDGVTIERVTTQDGVRVRVYRPARPRTDAGLLWIHGGGLIIGSAAQDDRLCATTAGELGITVVSAEYRKAPEHPFPAALDDCAAAWRWFQGTFQGTGVARIAVGGQSAGGGLAAALVQRIHDGGGPQPVAQWLFCPMLDDRTAGHAELDSVGHRVWNNRLNRFGWRSYLGVAPGSAEVPPYAVPARRTDLHGLPPAWIGVGDIDLFHDEDLEYARRLRAAGVEATFETVPGAPHGFEAWAPKTGVSRDYLATARAWLDRALGSGSDESTEPVGSAG